jgi:hypothetical protein
MRFEPDGPEQREAEREERARRDEEICDWYEQMADEQERSDE